MKILDAIQECSGLAVKVAVCRNDLVKIKWIRPPEDGLTLEEAERLIEEAGIKVTGRC